MNEHLFTNNDGLRLISTFEGAPRLKARLCEGGRYELGYGITFHLDGSPVLANQTCTEDQAMAMFRNALQRFEAAVRAHVTVPLNSNQFSALVAFSYNIGEANFSTSTVLRMVNQMRFEDAAAAFGMWVFATRDGYKQALRGLLRRRYAEACLFLGYDWTEACADEAVALQREKPASLPGADRVLYKTPFANILRVAQQYPLDAPQIAANAQAPVLVPTVLEPVQYVPAATADTPLDRQGIPIQLPIPREDELLLDQPAAPPKADAKGSPSVSEPPSPSSQAAVPSEISNTGTSKPASPVPAPTAPQSPPGPVSPLPAPSAPVGKPKDPPPVIAGQDGAKPKSPWTVQPEEVHYKIDPGAGLKPLEDSDRAKAFYWQRSFMFIIYLGGAGVFGSTFMAGSEVLMKHAALMSVLLDLIVPLAIALSGLVLGAVGKSWADWRRHCAQEKASQGLY